MSTGGRLEGFTLFLQFLVLKNHKNIEKSQKSPAPGPEYYVCLYRMIGKTAYGV
jgi:hypothetical protein